MVKTKGFGEIYEIMSVNNLLCELRRKYRHGTLLLSSNKDHVGRGLTLKELVKYVGEERVIELGYVDSPFWPSKPREENKRNKLLSASILTIVRILFRFLIFFERIKIDSKRRAHMVYVFVSI